MDVRRSMKTGKKYLIGDYLIGGGFAIVGMAEAAHLTAVFLGRPFSDCTVIWLALQAALLVAAVGHGIVRRCRSGMAGRTGRHFLAKFGIADWMLCAVLLLVIVSQLAFILAAGDGYRQGDMTVETVNSFLETNGVYSVNPLTGMPYTGGMPLRLKILCLPTLYGSICSLTGLAPQFVVWRLVPVLTLLGCYLAYGLLACSLFPENGKKRGCFLVAVSLLLWAENYMFCMDGFGVLSCGFRGVVIRNAVLLPWLFSLLIRKKWIAALPCIFVEACMVWTLYGLGACAAVTAGMAAAGFAGKVYAAGREAA